MSYQHLSENFNLDSEAVILLTCNTRPYLESCTSQCQNARYEYYKFHKYLWLCNT